MRILDFNTGRALSGRAMAPRTGMTPAARQRGFSLIEVLVSLLVLGFGLLGLALLQTTALKATQSANQRTIATNLAYEVMDMMRANRLLSFRYAYIDPSDVVAMRPLADTCDVAVDSGDVVADDSNNWMCHLVRALPNASADVVVAAGAATVTITWADERASWAPSPDTTLTVTSAL